MVSANEATSLINFAVYYPTNKTSTVLDGDKVGAILCLPKVYPKRIATHHLTVLPRLRRSLIKDFSFITRDIKGQ